MLEVYHPNTKPRPKLSFDINCNELIVTLVDKEGNYITDLFSSSGIRKHTKEALEEDGLDTSWAKWDNEGRFRELTNT